MRSTSSMRNWIAAVSLGSLGLLTSLVASHAAYADVASNGGHAPSSAGNLRLPAGIHLKKSGRYTRDLCDHTKKHFCLAQVLMPEGWTPDRPVPTHVPEGFGGGGGASGMGPSDIMAAYNIPASTTANGKIVAILDGPDSNAFSDLTAYRANYGLATLPKCASGKPTGSLPACFGQVSETGGTSTGEDSGSDSDGETSLDMDMISAACPDCSILLVEIGKTNGDIEDSDFITGTKTASDLGAVAISMSLGGPEGEGGGGGGADPTGYTTPGHLVLAASGDFGYDLVNEDNAGSPSYPASAPDVVAVGGTTLFKNSSTYDEAVWNDGTFSSNENGQDVTTSGCSTEYATPSWQATVLSGTGCAKRATADLSAAAAYYANGTNSDIATYESGWEPVEGTSASSPMVAAILTRLGLAETISNNIGWIYTNAAAFHDLGSASYPVDSQGSSTDQKSASAAACGKLCNVETGWDGPSGVGTPNGALLAALAGGASPPPVSVDAGTTTPPPSADSGTTTTTPPTSTDSGTSSSPPPATGTDSGAPPIVTSTPTPTPGSLGAGCTGPGSCNSSLCAEPSAGAAAVCTEACTLEDGGASSCGVGFACNSGYCFAAAATPPVLDAGDFGSGGSGSSGGCAVSSRDEGWTGVGWVAAGLVALGATRRRRARLVSDERPNGRAA